MGPRATQEGRRQHRTAHRQLSQKLTWQMTASGLFPRPFAVRQIGILPAQWGKTRNVRYWPKADIPLARVTSRLGLSRGRDLPIQRAITDVRQRRSGRRRRARRSSDRPVQRMRPETDSMWTARPGCQTFCYGTALSIAVQADPMSAFGGKADMRLCTANVRL